MGNNLKYHAKILTATSLLLCFIAPATALAQISISIGDQARCQHSEVLIPVHASEFLNVAALTLFIEIDTLKTQYLELENLHPEMSSGILSTSFNKNSSQIGIVWAQMLPVFIDNEKLFDIRLQYHSGNTPLVFTEYCEIAFSDYSIAENVIYEHGLIIPTAISILEHPESIHVDEGQQATFGIETETENSLEYRWQLHNGIEWTNIHDDDLFSGSDTEQLIIYDVSAELNNTIVRCMVYLDQCVEYSDPALLTVSEMPTQVSETDQPAPGLNVFPNPCSSQLFYEVDGPAMAFNLKMLNISGETVYRKNNAQPQGTVQVHAFDAGTYFLQLITHNNRRQTVKVIVVK